MSHHFVLGQSVAETCLGLPSETMRFEKQPHFHVKILLWSKPAMAVTAGGSAPYLAFTCDIIKFDSHFYSFCNVSLKTCKSSLAAF